MGRLLLLDREALTKSPMTFATEVINNKSIIESIRILTNRWLFGRFHKMKT